MDSLSISISTFVFGFLVFGVIKLFIKLWWIPLRIQRSMKAQGIEGPSYRFIQGNTREIYAKRMQVIATPIELSHHILPRVMPSLHNWLNLYGRNFLQWLGVDAQLVITDPEMIKEVLHDRQKNFPKLKLEGNIHRVFRNGLVTSKGEGWAKSRKIANFAFHGDRLKNTIPTMIECVETMLKDWKQYEGKEVDVFQRLKVYTLDVISHTAFGSSYEQGNNIFQLLQELCDLSIRNGYKIKLPIISKILKSKDDFEGERVEKRMKDCFMEIIRAREEKMMYGNDLLGLLVKAKNDPEKSQRISAEDIVDECKTFYFAGHETTNVLLSWTVFLLALHQEWQQEARNEVFNIFRDKNPTIEGLPKLRKMVMIINECLRLYLPAMLVSQRVEKDMRLGSLVLPTTIRLTIPTLAVHHDTAFWGEDAHEFKPERFLEGAAKATETNLSTYIPFGLGPRNCVGMNFLMNEAKIAMSMILQRYSFSLSSAYAHMSVQFLTVCPENGVQVILSSITDHKA